MSGEAAAIASVGVGLIFAAGTLWLNSRLGERNIIASETKTIIELLTAKVNLYYALLEDCRAGRPTPAEIPAPGTQPAARKADPPPLALMAGAGIAGAGVGEILLNVARYLLRHTP